MPERGSTTPGSADGSGIRARLCDLRTGARGRRVARRRFRGGLPRQVLEDLADQRPAVRCSGNKVGSEVHLPSLSTPVSDPDVAVLATGGFVVSWVENVFSRANTSNGVHAQMFGSNGAPVGSAFQVPATWREGNTMPSLPRCRAAGSWSCGRTIIPTPRFRSSKASLRRRGRQGRGRIHRPARCDQRRELAEPDRSGVGRPGRGLGRKPRRQRRVRGRRAPASRSSARTGRASALRCWST